MKNFAKGRVGLRRVSGLVLASLACSVFSTGGFGLPRSFATLVGVGGAGSLDWVSRRFASSEDSAGASGYLSFLFGYIGQNKSRFFLYFSRI